MENKINQAVRGTPEPCVLHRRKGLEVKQLFSPLPVEGEVFFLTFPFIEQAFTLATVWLRVQWRCYNSDLRVRRLPEPEDQKRMSFNGHTSSNC
jgi:hypothetical protein